MLNSSIVGCLKEHEPWCKKYMELYQELRENWERLYWDEGYSKKLAREHANYESSEDEDFSPYRLEFLQFSFSCIFVCCSYRLRKLYLFICLS